jgi:methionyl-tRNA formyltransferase
LFWQIKNGETSTGITAHKMNKRFDCGPVLFFESETITSNETYGFLESKLSFTLIRAVIGLLNLLQNNTPIPLVEQKEKDVSYFTGPTEKDLIIYWQNQNAVSVCNLVRACNPKFQGVVTSIRGTPLRILQVTLTEEKLESLTPGTILNDSTGNLKVVCADNNVLIIDIVYIQEGCFSGKVFKEIFNIQNGEVFV